MYDGVYSLFRRRKMKGFHQMRRPGQSVYARALEDNNNIIMTISNSNIAI
jgi:hypothetical protein